MQTIIHMVNCSSEGRSDRPIETQVHVVEQWHNLSLTASWLNVPNLAMWDIEMNNFCTAIQASQIADNNTPLKLKTDGVHDMNTSPHVTVSDQIFFCKDVKDV